MLPHQESELKELQDKLTECNQELSIAKKRLSDLQKKMNECESNFIAAKINQEKAFASLTAFESITPKDNDFTLRELEIEKFRQDNPETVAMARQRDIDRDKDVQ